MKNKNIPALISLCAGAIASITCIVNNYSLLDTLWIVLVTLFAFYIIGRIVGRIIGKINKDANEAYVMSERERMNAEKNLRTINETEIQETTSEDIQH